MIRRIQKFFTGNREHQRRWHSNKKLSTKELFKLIQELQNLNDNIAKLNDTIASAVAKLGAPHATPAEVQAAADAVASATSTLQAAVDSAP